MSAETRVRKAFEEQAVACAKLGSPFTAALCRLAASRLTTNNAVGRNILSWPGDPGGMADSIPLRLAGALHALVLNGQAMDLAAYYPPNEGWVDAEAFWSVIDRILSGQADTILLQMERAPQTNEVRRAGVLLPGFLSIAKEFGLPLMLSELGCSAGLNLLWDQFGIRLGDQQFGPDDAAVTMAPDWVGSAVEGAAVTIHSRRGCDLNPLAVGEPDVTNRLLSYIWPDQPDRFTRTRAAIDLFNAAEVKVDKSDAIDWLEPRLAMQPDGVCHVVYHTIAWQYFPTEAQARGTALIETAGAMAGPDRPLAWLRLEGDDQTPGAALTLTTWPKGETHLLARADFHGRWIDWLVD